MAESEKNSSLSKSISLEDFIEIFKTIDCQILELHQCSSEDFLGLNADFKQYFRQSKTISQNASEIFNIITETSSGELLKNLKTLYQDLTILQNDFSVPLANTVESLKQIHSELDKLFLPVKNLNQDLMTLKFLLANLKISNTLSQGTNQKNNDKLLATYNQIINDFKLCSFQNEINLANLKDQVKKTLIAFEKIKGRNIHDFEMILNHIHYGIILFAEKHEEVSRLIPELTNRTESSAQSIADIITNLQYHDIIRQKMEHIQTTHKNVIADLESTDDETSGEGKNKLLMRIRDIANLQSAQLVHANKEYQKAIEVITQKFLDIGQDMGNIATLCHDLNASGENSDELHLNGLLEKLNDSANVLTLFVEAGDSFTRHLDILAESIAQANETISNFARALKDLKQITTETINLYTEANTFDSQLQKSLEQVRDLSLDIERFESTIQEVFLSVKNIESNINQDIDRHIRTPQKVGTIIQAADRLNEIITRLNTQNQSIAKLLDENLEISQGVFIDVRDSIKKIRYYDFFEKVIVDIIGEFNSISQKLKQEFGGDQGQSNQEIDSIKNLYTMASEHRIHDKVVSNQGEVDLFDDEKQTIEDDDDNLELF